jgi:hypothetical protein
MRAIGNAVLVTLVVLVACDPAIGAAAAAAALGLTTLARGGRDGRGSIQGQARSGRPLATIAKRMGLPRDAVRMLLRT